MRLLLGNHFPYAHGVVWGVSVPEFWEPLQLLGISAWFDADDASTITLNGSNVSQWTDKTGNPNVAAQPIATSQPLLVSRGLQFDGINDYMDITGTDVQSIIQPFTLTMVVNRNDGDAFKPTTDGITSSNGRIVTGNGLATNTDGMFAGINLNAATRITEEAVRIYSFAGTNSGYYRNGELVITGDAGANDLRDGLRLAADHDLSGTNYSNVLFREVIIVREDMTDLDRQNVEGYLAWKWGSV